jgi:hypothetical protein
LKDIDGVRTLVENKIIENSDNVNWLIQRYFVPMDVLKTDVHVEVLGFINDSKTGTTVESPEISFARVLMNPDPKGKSRDIHVAEKTNFVSKL